MDREEYITIGPRDFIRPPFIKCPKCGKNSFGILSICSDRFWRRCKECLYPRPDDKIDSFPLPSLKKKIIYLDQFAISNMMKSLNPSTRAFKKGQLDIYWSELFKKLDLLSKLQLITCPFSEFHEEESALFEFKKQLDTMCQLISGGVEFKSVTEIKCEQIYQHSKNWINGIESYDFNLDAKTVIQGNIEGWQERILFISPPFLDDELAEEIKHRRDKSHGELSAIFSQWKFEFGKSFDDWYDEEWRSFGTATLNTLKETSSYMVILTIQNVFKRAGVDESDMTLKIKEYLTSDSMEHIPFNKIRALLFAGLAQKARKGQKKLRSKGMMNDVQFISYLLPYCDAMFIDNECRGLLKSFPVRDRIQYGTKVFSQNNKDEFIEYLNEIEKQMSEEHFKKVKEVYGEEWLTPYTSLFEK